MNLPSSSPPQAQAFLDAVARFKEWSSTVPEDRRSGEWECDFSDWHTIYSAWKSLLDAGPLDGWARTLVDAALYAVARDNECGVLVKALSSTSARFLAEASTNSPEADAKWQLAVKLAEHPGAQTERLLLTFAEDEAEYVRRRAIQSLARIGSPSAVRLAIREWDLAPDDFPWSRMSALWVLHHTSDARLQAYLERAEFASNAYLREYAAKLRRGEVAT